MVKVQQFEANNQFIIFENNKLIFQSYNSIICIIDNKNKVITFGKDYKFSSTTSKYRNKFLTLYFNKLLASTKLVDEAIKNNTCYGYKVILNENI